MYKNSDLNRFEPIFTILDCEQAAYSGLFDAYKKYDSSKGSFKNFAYKRIKGEVLDQIIEVLPITRSIFKNMREKKKSLPRTYNLENTLVEVGETEVKDTIKSEVNSYFDEIDTIDELFLILRGFSDREKKIFIYHNLAGNTLEETAKIVGLHRQTLWYSHPKLMARIREKVEKRNLCAS